MLSSESKLGTVHSFKRRERKRRLDVFCAWQYAPPAGAPQIFAAAARCGNRAFGDQPSRRTVLISRRAQCHDLLCILCGLRAILAPRIHQLAALVEQIAAT